MLRVLLFTCGVLEAAFGVTTSVAIAQDASLATCSGELSKMVGGYMVEACTLTEAAAKKVMQSCSVGSQCVVKGLARHCPAVRGACLELFRVTSVQRGNQLPPCDRNAGIARADQWWTNGASVILKGTITQSDEAHDVGSPPYGHMAVVMDLTTCSTGSPMAIDKVPERYVGHYVNLQGTAWKGLNGWYVNAGQIDDIK
jgi:hypothetical protein